MIIREPKFKEWERYGPETFLWENWKHPIRRAAFLAVMEDRPDSIAEIGPGQGHDYKALFRPWVLSCKIRYTMIEGTRSFVEYLRGEYPEADVIEGTFESLSPRGYDTVYTKDTLEQQPELEGPLRLFLGAAKRIAVVAWFLPPGEKFERCADPVGSPENRWARTDVLGIVEAEGFRLARTEKYRHKMADGELWRLTRT